MLPKLTPLQYTLLHLLFAGPQSGDELRQALRALGVRQSVAAFSRLIARLVDANYIDPQPGKRSQNGQTVHFRRYEITDLGLFDWMAAQKFYLNLAPPSPDLTPVPTESGKLAAYDPKTRKAVLDRSIRSDVRRIASTMLQIVRKSLAKRPTGLV
jgi:hypothetical protein